LAADPVLFELLETGVLKPLELVALMSTLGGFVKTGVLLSVFSTGVLGDRSASETGFGSTWTLESLRTHEMNDENPGNFRCESFCLLA
jgi:hypothetical protein